MFWFSVPRPYTSHEPIEGFGSCSDPVVMKRCATSCAGISVHIERMIAMSSMHLARFGNTSETSTPDLPDLVNLKGDPNARPSWPGIVLPSYCESTGFGSHVSTCDGAPSAKMWITCFAFTGKCGDFGASGLRFVPTAASASNALMPKSDARLRAPKPMPVRQRNCRRVVMMSSAEGVCSRRYFEDRLCGFIADVE